MSIERVTLSALMMGQVVQNVMHFDNPDGALTLAQVADEIKLQFLPDYRSVVSGSVTWFNIQVKTVDSGNSSPYNLAINIQGAQSGSTADLPFCCWVININTGIVGRHNRGRLFVPGMGANLTLNGLVKVEIVGLWDTPLANLTAKYKSGGSRGITLGVAPRATPQNFVAMTALTLSSKVGIQRRRNIGVGM